LVLSVGFRKIKKGPEKVLTEGTAKRFADSLSLIGELFEIYFVRLIGTPNQNSKTIPTSVGIMLVVVHESLGS